MRRAELWLVLVCAVLLGVAVFAGRARAPAERRYDPRASTYLAGPNGAKGLAQTLRRLGVPVRQWRRPLFDLARDTAPARRAERYAFLDIFIPPHQEIAAVRELVARGGRVFVAGWTGIERCFGYASRYLGGDRWEELVEPVAVTPPDPGWRLPGTRRVMERLPTESLYVRPENDDEAGGVCEALLPARHRVLLGTVDGRPVAVRLEFRGGGEAILLADVQFVRNRALKETDAGLLVIPWLTQGGVRRVVVDEFHQGFGSGRTVWDLGGAAARWLAAEPAGWGVLQLGAVGALALLMAAARSGPSRPGVERRRRSPLEHVEALAAGLEGAGGSETAVDLIVNGLRRRLGRSGYSPAGDHGHAWLATLELALPGERGRRAVRRLQWLLTQPGGDERVLGAAEAVEDVWEELHPPKPRA